MGAKGKRGSNAGDQVYAGVEVSTIIVGAATPTLTLKYTDQAGNAGHTATNILATVAAPAVGAFYDIGLTAGDQGVRKAESLTLSAAWTSGTIHVVLYRVLARLELTAAHTPNAIDALTGGFCSMWNNSVPMLLFLPSTTTASNIVGQAIWSQG